MADQLDSNPRASNPDEDGDDPLAELARIIGYEKPVEAGADQQAADESEPGAFDLEAELMRELDVLPADDADNEHEPETAEPIAEEAFADAVPADDAMNRSGGGAPAEVGSAESEGALDASWLDNKPKDTDFDGDAVGEAVPESLHSPLAAEDADAAAIGDRDELGQVIGPDGASPMAPSLEASDDAAWPDNTIWADDDDATGPAVTSGSAGMAGSEEAEEIAWPEGGSDADSSDVFDVAAENAWQAVAEDQPAEPAAFDLESHATRDASEAYGAPGASEMNEDYVLADMVRFDMPVQQSASGGDDAAYQALDDEPVTSQPDAAGLPVEDADAESHEADDFDLELASALSAMDEVASGNGRPSGDDRPESAERSADAGELTPRGSDTSGAPDAADAPLVGPATAVSIDFEDYLSAELDVFGYETDDSFDRPVEAQSPGSATEPGEATQGPAPASVDVAAPQAETAPSHDVDADAFEPEAGETESVFDDAAEELLADIEQETAIAEAEDFFSPETDAADDAGSGYSAMDEPAVVGQSDNIAAPASDVSDDWPDADLDEGLSEELSAELEDSFDVSPQGEETDAQIDAGELEFDLEQVLAETVIDDTPSADPATALHDGVLEEPQAAEDEVERALETAENETSNLMAGTEAESEHDEMTKAFLGLMPEVEQQFDATVAGPDLETGVEPDEPATAAEPEPEFESGFDNGSETGSDAEVETDASRDPASAEFPSRQSAGVEPGAPVSNDDWLAGFDQTAERPQNGEDGFFFDASTISEPEEPVQPVAEFDVPEIADDEPRPEVSDYDADIEREFADIIDTEASHISAAARAHAEQPTIAPDLAGEWSVDSLDGPGYEASDDYIALERELGVEDADVAPPYGEAATREQAAASFDGEYATGMNVEPEPEKDSRGPMVAFAVLGLALLAGAGAFGWSMLSGGDVTSAEGPRIIRADKEPVKVLPENPGGVTVPNQDKAVYDRVAGGDGTETGQPALVNTAEEPVDVVQRTLDPDMLPLEGRDSPANVKSEERLAVNNGDAAETGANAGTAPVVSPRRVRTMIVKPDGSIVAREDPAPESAELRPTVSEPEAETAEVDSATPDPAAAEDPVVSNSGPTLVQPAATTETGVADAAAGDTSPTTVAPVRVVTTRPIRAPIPEGRPADQPVNVVGTVTQGGNVSGGQPASTTPEPDAQPQEVAVAPTAAAPAANPGGYYVQIASQPTAEGAQSTWRTLSGRFSSVLGGRGVDIQRADIPGKGVFHRVRVPAGSRSQANALCSRYKAAGGSCFVSR